MWRLTLDAPQPFPAAAPPAPSAPFNDRLRLAPPARPSPDHRPSTTGFAWPRPPVARPPPLNDRLRLAPLFPEVHAP
ncbi:hypothetical protein GCM10010388_58890 [Streptomyces mauvecolor]